MLTICLFAVQFTQITEGLEIQVGLHEISPLERHYQKTQSPGGTSGSSEPSADDKLDKDKS